MKVPNYRCEAWPRTTPAGKWSYWIFDGDQMIEGTVSNFSSEAEAFRAGYERTEQIERKKHG
jgi:hypothetical protein